MAFGKHPAIVDETSYGQLTCKCGSEYLHQRDVTIFHRGEDGDNVTVIAQDGDKVETSKFPNDDTCNPSPRRHGLIIEFECESCSYDFNNTKIGESPKPIGNQRLAIYQHKGCTYMEWV
jgi:hypothetical protein